jgi:F-type H+-transporting ATPase subunit b
MLELNSSFVFVFLLIWGLMIVLNRIFFRPVGRILDEREARVKGDSEKLDSLVREIEEKTRRVEVMIADARDESFRIREGWIRKGEEFRETLIENAREKSARQFEEQMKRLETEIAAAQKQLESEVSIFSQKIKEAFL